MSAKQVNNISNTYKGDTVGVKVVPVKSDTTSSDLSCESPPAMLKMEEPGVIVAANDPSRFRHCPFGPIGGQIVKCPFGNIGEPVVHQASNEKAKRFEGRGYQITTPTTPILHWGRPINNQQWLYKSPPSIKTSPPVYCYLASGLYRSPPSPSAGHVTHVVPKPVSRWSLCPTCGPKHTEKKHEEILEAERRLSKNVLV